MSSASSASVLLPGSSRAEWAAARSASSTAAPPAFESFQGTLATQEYIQATIAYNPADVDRIISAPAGHDGSVWLYESLRQLLLELGVFVCCLGEVCSASSCPKMTATPQWEFMCAAHPGQPRHCAAIDYCVHTLSGFDVLLTSPDAFPTRYTISAKSAQQFGNVVRRLYRALAHAFYHHREMFDEHEARTHIARRFTQFALKYELMTEKLMAPPLTFSAPAAR